MPDCDVIYGCDAAWWHKNIKDLPEGPEFWAGDRSAYLNLGVNHIHVKPGKGLSTTPGQLYAGKNSGYQAINFAYHRGVSRIVLLGFDMQHTGGRAHWHPDHPKGLGNAEGIGGWIKYFGPLASDLAAEGVDVVNCSPETALKCFRRESLELVD